MQNKNRVSTAEEFTKAISPTRDGLRSFLQDAGKLSYVHEWMGIYASQELSSAMEEINELKKEVEILRDYKEILEIELRLEKQEIEKLKELANLANLLEAFKNCYGALRVTTGRAYSDYDSIITAYEGKNTER